MHRSFTAALAVGLAACSSGAPAADAPSSAWSLGPTMPRKALAAGVALLGQQVVVVGGFDSGAAEGLDVTSRVDAFDVGENRWTTLPGAPVEWTDLDLAVIGDTLYIAGGLERTAGLAHGETYMLDPLTGQWTQLAAMAAGDERGAAGVVSAPGHIYLLGGASTTAALASCLDYDIIMNSWTRLPDLPVARSHPAAMRMNDGTLIVAGGFAGTDSSQPLGDVLALPPPGVTPRTWQPRTATATPPNAAAGCSYGVVLGQLICAGGEIGQAALDAVQSYDPYTNVWSAGEPMPAARADAQGAATGGRLFVPGGSATLALEPTDTLYIYAPLDSGMPL